MAGVPMMELVKLIKIQYMIIYSSGKSNCWESADGTGFGAGDGSGRGDGSGWGYGNGYGWGFGWGSGEGSDDGTGIAY